MAIEIFMPALSPTMKEGLIAKWHKNEGDKVAPGDVLCEITTDKSTVEYQALDEGFLKKIVVQEGKSAAVNKQIAVLTESMEEDISSLLQKKSSEQKEKQQPRDAEKTDQDSVPVKTSVPMKGPEFVPFGPLPDYHFSEPSSSFQATPLAKRLAKEGDLDIAKIKGSGPGGRIVAEDLKGAPKKSPFSRAPKGEVPTLHPGTYHEISVTPIRKSIGERLQQSKMFIPHFYVTMEIHVSKLVHMRKDLSQVGTKVTFNDFILRAAALSLEKHPEINRGYNSVNETIIQFETIDISLAVSIPDGLITPIIFHANYKDLHTLSFEARSLAKKALAHQLQPKEYQGGSFTISNLGMFAIESFDAVINPPQAAILAIGGILEKPVVTHGKVEAAHVMKITLSCDHRVIDGADAAKFLQTIKFYLENPLSLIS